MIPVPAAAERSTNNAAEESNSAKPPKSPGCKIPAAMAFGLYINERKKVTQW